VGGGGKGGRDTVGLTTRGQMSEGRDPRPGFGDKSHPGKTPRCVFNPFPNLGAKKAKIGR